MSSTRKPLFNKPAWASKPVAEKSAKDHTKDASIFSQSHLYDDILAEERKRRERHMQRAQERKDRASLTPKKHADNRPQDRDRSLRVGNGKRRRLSKDSQEEEEESGLSHEDADNSEGRRSNHSSKDDQSSDSDRPTLRSAPKKNTRLVDRLDTSSPRKNKGESRSPMVPNIIALDDDESDDGSAAIELVKKNREAYKANRAASAKVPEPQPKEPASDSEEDEYLRELKRKAREDAKLKKTGVGQRENSSDRTTDGRSFSGAAHSPVVGDIASPASEAQSNTVRDTPTPVPDDPLVQILIQTMIPGANPLIVQRRASQPLDRVKQYWCERNNLHPTIVSKVFFTWNGTRLYNSTTMRGIMELLKKTHPTSDGRDPSNGKIEIEAMTDEIFEYRRMQQERKRKEAAGIRDPSPDTQQGDQDQVNGSQTGENAEVEEQRSGPVIKLSCPDIEDLAMRVRPRSTVAKIITAFRRLRNIDASKECWLSYDGDRLTDDQTVEEVGFEDEDKVEVYLR